MRKFTLTILLIPISLAIYSQAMILHDPVSARVFNSTRYSDISGTPFLKDVWTKGSVTTPKGIYKDLELKLDAYSNTLYFKKDDKPYEFEEKISGFTLMPNPADSSTFIYYRNGLGGNGIKPDQYVQVLANGKASFYKLESKLLSEINQINQGVVKSFTNSTRYYVFHNNEFHQIRLSKPEVMNLMGDKKAQVELFVKDNDINFRRDADISRVIKYYNSL